MKRACYKTDKKIIDNLIKYFMHCQNYRKTTCRFKFILKKDASFNYLILDDILYIDDKSILYVIDEAKRF